MKLSQRIYQLEPQYRERVWGGQTLKAHDPPIGEVWSAFEGSRVRAGTQAGKSVAELTTAYGAAFVGDEVARRFVGRFPLLIKLLDCADWLSVQVHPNDEQAQVMVGTGCYGKTEAWHFLKVDPGATIMAGVKPGTTRDTLAAAIRSGDILQVAHTFEVHAGETYLLHAGTLHALGPGLVLYEVQQASDTTYRVYDWGRPVTMGRSLHLEESVAVIDPLKSAVLTPPPAVHGTSATHLVRCPFFSLDTLQISESSLTGDTAGRTFAVLTVTAGTVKITCGDEAALLGRYETALVAGTAGAYELHAVNGPAAVLQATLPQ